MRSKYISNTISKRKGFPKVSTYFSLLFNAEFSSKSTPLPILFMQKSIAGKNKIRFCKSSKAHSGRIQWADALCWWDGNGPPPWTPPPVPVALITHIPYIPIPYYPCIYRVVLGPVAVCHMRFGCLPNIDYVPSNMNGSALRWLRSSGGRIRGIGYGYGPNPEV